jgi:hypothetical protein
MGTQRHKRGQMQTEPSVTMAIVEDDGDDNVNMKVSASAQQQICCFSPSNQPLTKIPHASAARQLVRRLNRKKSLTTRHHEVVGVPTSAKLAWKQRRRSSNRSIKGWIWIDVATVTISAVVAVIFCWSGSAEPLTADLCSARHGA